MATLLHHTTNSDFSGTSLASLSVTIPSTTAGSTLKVWVQYGAGTTNLSNIQDNKGGGSSSYTIKTRVNDAGANQSAACAFTANCASGITSVTMNMSPNTPFLAITVEEWSGESTTPDDGSTGQFQSTPGTGGNAITSGTVTTTVSGDTIDGYCFDQRRANPTMNIGTGYTVVDDLRSTINSITEQQTQGSAGAIAATFTDATNGNVDAYVSLVMAFKPGATDVLNSQACL